MKIKLTENQISFVVKEALKRAISIKLDEYESRDIDDYIIDLINSLRYFSTEEEYQEFLSSKQHTKFFISRFKYD